MKSLILLVTFIICSNSQAEYRAYQYIVKNKINTANDQPNGHIIVSTLNPVSYIAYHGGRQMLQVDLLRTWMCPGDTSYKKDICPSPYGQLPKEVVQ
jgi:hypothetical protein